MSGVDWGGRGGDVPEGVDAHDSVAFFLSGERIWGGLEDGGTFRPALLSWNFLALWLFLRMVEGDFRLEDSALDDRGVASTERVTNSLSKTFSMMSRARGLCFAISLYVSRTYAMEIP